MDRRTSMPVAALCLALLAVGGCKKKDQDTSAAAPPAAPPPAATAPAAPVAVTAVNLGKSIGADRRVTGETTQFGVNDTIYASVQTSGTGNASLTARWTYQDGQTVDETTQSVAASGPAATEFHISKPGGWPAGRYKVAVLLNGTQAQEKEFTVQ